MERKLNNTSNEFSIFKAIGICELTNVKSKKYLKTKIENYYGIKTKTFKKNGRTFLIQK